MSPRPNNQDARSVVVSNQPAATMSDDPQQAALDNPYLVGLSKKTRGLRKKLDKIKKTEVLHSSGKQLNDEQMKLLESKPFLVFALAEHERVRTVMENIAKEQAQTEEQEIKSNVPEPSMDSASASVGLSIPSNESEVVLALSIPSGEGAARSEASVQTDAQDVLGGENQAQTEMASNLESIGISTEPICVESVEIQTDWSGPPPPVPRGLDPRQVSEAMAAAAATAAEQKRVAQAEAEAKGLAVGRAEAVTGVAKLLRLLHVANRFEAKGERLPTAVDFFSKVLLGKTVPPDEADFDSCLEQSVERAMLYLDSRNGSREVAPGLSFSGLETMVSDLRDEIVAPPAAEPPLFNFFGDTCISVDGDEESDASPDESEVACDVGVPDERERAPEEVATPQEISSPHRALTTEEVSASEGPALRVPEVTNNGIHLHEESGRKRREAGQTVRSREMSGPPGDSGFPDPSVEVEGERGPINTSLAMSLVQSSNPAHEPGPTVPFSSREPHDAGQEHPSRPDMADHSEGQASRMEEGVLLPVMTPSTPHYPPTAVADSAIVDTAAVVESDAALPKRERRTKPCVTSPASVSASAPAPAFPPAPAVQQQQQHYIPPVQGVPPVQTVSHSHHVGSFPQEPTTPLTPVQMGHTGGHTMASTVPALSPPTGNPMGTPAPGGSPVLAPHAGWCYNQAAPLPPQVVLTHRQTHARLPQQQPNVRPPGHGHMVPDSLKSDVPQCNGPWVGRPPSTMAYPGEGSKMQQDVSQVVIDGGTGEGTFAGGLGLAPEHPSHPSHPSHAPHAPPDLASIGASRASPSPLNNVPEPPQNIPPRQSLGDSTVQYSNGSSAPSPRTSRVGKIQDSEAESGEPWQGVEHEGASSAVGDREAKYGADPPKKEGLSSVGQDEAETPGNPLPGNEPPPSTLNLEEPGRAIEGDHRAPQLVPSNETEVLARDMKQMQQQPPPVDPSPSSSPSGPSEETPGSALVPNQAVPDSPSATDSPPVPNPREAHGRARGTGSRGRGPRRADHRIKSRHPMPQSRRGGSDEVASKEHGHGQGQGHAQDQDQEGQGQSQAQGQIQRGGHIHSQNQRVGQGQGQRLGQGQGQGQLAPNPRTSADVIDQKHLKPHGRFRHQGRVHQSQQHPRVNSQAQTRDNGVYPRHHKRQVLSDNAQACRDGDGDDRPQTAPNAKNVGINGGVADPVDQASRKNRNDLPGTEAAPPAPAPGAMRWADDMTSSDSSPPVQRVMGSRRSRQSSHRSSAEGKHMAAERRVHGGSDGQGRPQSEKHETLPANENNARDSTHPTRNSERVSGADDAKVPHRSVAVTSAMAPVASSRSREHAPRTHVESNGNMSGTVPLDVRNGRNSSSPDEDPRYRGDVSGGMLTRGAGAPQRTSSRKNRTNTMHRRRGGGSSGVKGGRGSVGMGRGSFEEGYPGQQRRTEGKHEQRHEQRVDPQPSAER